MCNFTNVCQTQEEEEILQDPIIVGPINPIQPLQINFDFGADADNDDQEINMTEELALLPINEDAAEYWRQLNTYNQFKGNEDAAKL